MELKNNLNKENSPYLLQHKENPVWWQPWGEEAFSLAKKYDKPIFLSVGYSTCHWCHVMEEQSFEKQDVADVLNKHFISIKVDREERPDVDEIYMQAVQALSGHGGWPMSVWLTPELKPFFGATYFPKDHFIQALEQIASAWENKRDLINQDSSRLTEYLDKSLTLNTTGRGTVSEGILLEFHRSFGDAFDEQFGGFSGAPKFPVSMQLMSLMRIARRLESSDASIWVNKTLREMCYRGMYDHTNGGFHRYSTDEEWIVPHFEKMLYDNALLSMTYLEAYQNYKNEEYRLVCEETLDYVLREMTSSEGGFYSAQDADSFDSETQKKQEGSFAIWDYKKLKSLLDVHEFGRLSDVFDLSIEGNFEGKNILTLKKDSNFLERSQVKDILNKLSKHRSTRPQPHLDEKILTEWNGLMIASLARAGRVLDSKYLEAASKAAEFIFSKLFVDNTLYRCYSTGGAKISAFSEDYATMIFACTELYQSSFDEKWYERAILLQEKMNRLFWDEDDFAYYKTDGTDSSIITRSKPSYDGVQPNPNSMACYNLLRLYHLSYNEDYKLQAQNLFETFKAHLEFSPQSLSFMILAIDLFNDQAQELVIAGDLSSKKIKEALSEFNAQFLPSVVVAHGPSKKVGLAKEKTAFNETPTFYLCKNQTCTAPTENIESIKSQLQQVSFINP